ncbi:efflux transporter outer membrane subunit [Altericroceibacterium spongiae]|uniref:Efflux transporter outer membrane subunit n=1 Tax=Altericroceibacterium spongiae TaxID=2320269 RepID=A0A420ECD4_9SPHN|nr:efflux transporter outer membrane subunit [Altericroceibacterium spongiae]RKF18336.1 efflux transporter outer membrane subunit [Altericroceibacterium spongiae]
MRLRILPYMLVPLLAACTVGPDYERPSVAGETGHWTNPAADGPVNLEPWRNLGDPLLVDLVEQAVAANLDLKAADARLREARAGLDVAVGGRLPEAQVSGSATRQQLSENGQLPVNLFPGFDREFSLFDAGFDASWEVDLWGGQQREVEAARARLRAAAAEKQDVRLRVVAEVERAYAELRGAQADKASLTEDAQSYTTLADLLHQSYAMGEIARSGDADAQASARSAQAQIPGAQARITAAINALALLTGQPPEAVTQALSEPAPLPQVPGTISPGLRADILRRRPDVMAAESQLAAATAEVGVATAELFPKFSLLGSIGQQARSVDDLTSGGSTRFQIGPSLSWPIFSGGRIRAQIRAADARADGAAAQYEKAVLGALSDSETALNRYNAAVAAAQERTAASVQAETSFRLAQQRYSAGEDSRVQWMQAIVRRNQTARAASDARMQALQAHAALVKALGGGWSEEDTPPQS